MTWRPATTDPTTLWARPAGPLAAPVEPLSPDNSLQAAANHLIDYGVPAVPVVQDERYIGLVTESDIVRALARGAVPTSPVLLAIDPTAPPYPTLLARSSASEALRLFEASRLPALAVTDDDGRVIGVLTPSRLTATTDREARPKLVGGMATPFGVYLTGGGVTGGVQPLALVATGALLFATFLAGAYLALAVGAVLPPAVQRSTVFDPLVHGLGLLFFFLLMRALPLTGYHAAEHMTVHAIEQGEPVEPETVARMPRVHPRCGTNLAVAVALFLGVLSLPWPGGQETGVLLGLLAALFLFRPIGSFVQFFFTTRPPTPAQIQAGVQAGKSLLHNYQTARRTRSGPFERLVQSGLFHVLAGSFSASLLAAAITQALNLPPYWRVL